jgi:hypothetical protein
MLTSLNNAEARHRSLAAPRASELLQFNRFGTLFTRDLMRHGTVSSSNADELKPHLPTRNIDDATRRASLAVT